MTGTTESPRTTNSTSLILARDRDAYAAIRGFVYQVDLTVVRWIDLTDDEVLELERGEDIDHVRREIGDAGLDDVERLMEQVKFRVTPLTLRSPGLREAFANFHEHTLGNPGQRLKLRFTTNAPASVEKGAAFGDGIGGVDMWRQLHAGAVGADLKMAMLAGIRALLVSATAPAGVSSGSWSSWQGFVATATNEELEAFVGRVEISHDAPDVESMGLQIEDMLLERGHAATRAEARAVYNVLFVSVFKRLGMEGLKQVRRADLVTEVRGGGLAADQHQLAERLQHLAGAVDKRLSVIEDELAALRTDVTETRISVAGISRSFGRA